MPDNLPPSLHELNILKLTEKYKGKKIEELFTNHSILQNSMGSLMEISWQFSHICYEFILSSTKKTLLQNLKSIDKIGEVTENYLLSREVHTIYDLTNHLKYQDSAEDILNLINKKDFRALCNKKNIYDIDLLFCFETEDLLFLDIETLGLTLSPIIIVGIGFFKKEAFHINILFARDLEEKIAILEHLRCSIFPKCKCFVTFNGKSFDIPYLVNRFQYYFEENPLIDGQDTSYQTINTRFHHVDLYHNCRRKYRGALNRFNLSSIEQHLLQMRRNNDIDGSWVNTCYHKYLKDSKKYSGLMKKSIDHNFQDVCSMPLFLQKLVEPTGKLIL